MMPLGKEFRQQFPSFRAHPNLAYLDSAATSLKPDCFIQSMEKALGIGYGTVHRAVYRLARDATTEYEGVRERLAKKLGSSTSRQLIWTRGTTDAINLVARGLEHLFKPGDEIILSVLEHHSNWVPWQMLAKRTGARLRLVEACPNGCLDKEQLIGLLNPRTRLLALSHMPNTTGRLQDFTESFALAKQMGAWCLLDGAQAISSAPVEVEQLGCDFYAFSFHKLYGPTGLGCLWGTEEALEQLDPRDGGGEMVDRVELESSSYTQLPLRLEAGTPPIAEVLALRGALDFMDSLDMAQLLCHKQYLVQEAISRLESIPSIRFFVDPGVSTLLLFTIGGIHPLDLATLLDCSNVAVRTGHMCAQPALRRLGLESALRVSFGAYSDLDHLDQLQGALLAALKILR